MKTHVKHWLRTNLAQQLCQRHLTQLRHLPSDMQIDEGYLSAPEAVEFPTEGGKTAFMNHYPPKNKDYRLPSGHLPPLLVKIHGGPTSQASTGFNLALQFWTSRGDDFVSSNSAGADSCCAGAQGRLDPSLHGLAHHTRC